MEESYYSCHYINYYDDQTDMTKEVIVYLKCVIFH